jgi:predicted transcriptional regulator
MLMAKTVTSIKVDEDTWKKIKIQAITQEKQLSEILDDALKHWLKVQEKQK